MKFLTLLCALAVSASALAQNASPAQLAKMEKTYLAAKAALAKKPKDAKAKDAFVTAGVKFGHESMVSSHLSAKIKYRQALRVYREVLKVDPKNPVAKPEKELIEGIYKQMGRPIPK